MQPSKWVFSENKDRKFILLNSNIKYQVVNNNPLTEYIVLENNILLPIFPRNIKIDNNEEDVNVKLNVKFGNVKLLDQSLLLSLDNKSYNKYAKYWNSCL